VKFSQSQLTFHKSISPPSSWWKGKSSKSTDCRLFHAGFLPGLFFATEDVGSSEILVHFHKSVRLYIPDDRYLQSQPWEPQIQKRWYSFLVSTFVPWCSYTNWYQELKWTVRIWHRNSAETLSAERMGESMCVCIVQLTLCIPGCVRQNGSIQICMKKLKCKEYSLQFYSE
jgi:hypothetical protein